MEDTENIALVGSSESSDDEMIIEHTEICNTKKKRNTQKRNKQDSSLQIETIVLDDDSLTTSNGNKTHHSVETNSTFKHIIDITNDNNQLWKSKHRFLCEENPILAELIEKCFELENSEGMLRVVNKTLMRLYGDVDKSLRKSDEMKKLLVRTTGLLEKDPKHKFSHIKNLCESLKSHKLFSKKVLLKTMATNLIGSNRKRRNSAIIVTEPSKRSRINQSKKKSVITIDDDDDVIVVGNNNNEVHSKNNYFNNNTINLISEKDGETYNHKMQETNHLIINNDNESLSIELMESENKKDLEQENEIIMNTDSLNDVALSKAQPIVTVSNITLLPQVTLLNSELEQEIENQMMTKNIYSPCRNNVEKSDAQPDTLVGHVIAVKDKIRSCESDNHLIPVAETESSSFISTDKRARVLALETKIANLKNSISKLEVQEVEYDNCISPYIVCEKLKAEVVSLYKELCQLVGEQPVKQCKIRLKVLEGHPPGPTKLLEAFLNDNIGSDGLPTFPDFLDVVTCVVKSNEVDNLHWNKSQVMNEARVLFQQCGKALQKRRQRREWRDLMSIIKVEEDEDNLKDPADYDPELMARLDANRRIGLKKEAIVFERFSAMQLNPTSTVVSYCNESSSQNKSHIFDHNMDQSITAHICKSGNERHVIENIVDINSHKHPNRKCSDSINDLERKENVINELNQISENIENVTNENTVTKVEHVTMEQKVTNVDSQYKENVTIEQKVTNVENQHIENVTVEQNVTNLVSQYKENVTIEQKVVNVVSPHKENVKNEHEDTNADSKHQESVNTHHEGYNLEYSNDNCSEFPPVHVKTEKDDETPELSNGDSIIKQLEALGDNYTAEIVYIEDPFLVIEISSDEDD